MSHFRAFIPHFSALNPGKRIWHIIHYKFLNFAVANGYLTAAEKTIIQHGKRQRLRITEFMVNQWKTVLEAHPDKRFVKVPSNMKRKRT